MPKNEHTNESLLKEIRENFTWCTEYWREIRAEARTDMKFIAGDPWDPEERQRRKGKRPCLSLDELGQYVNQLINEVRQNPRAIKLIPTGSGANDKSAEWRAGLIRQIEYKSNAQAAYATAFESAVQRSYGAFRINTQYVDDEGFEQEPVIKRIPNPDTVYFDPDARETDCSDGEMCFVLDYLSKEKFKRLYPKAEIRDFTSEHMEAAPQWIREKDVQIAEYWKVTKEEKLLNSAGKTRKSFKRKVIQYITNGIEILETNEWAGKWIPIIPVFGKELYLDDGSGAKRKLMSLIRLARDPYMLYCYYRTTESEVVKMAPKTPYIGYVGQFAGQESEWQRVSDDPLAFLQVNPITDATGQQVLPLPQRQPYEPVIQQLELGAESARRAIQAAMGITSLPTAAQRQNEKSGVALQRIESQQQRGSFHFLDNFEHALEHAGRILNDLLDVTHDTARDVVIRKPDDSHALIHINEPWTNPATGQQEHHKVGDGSYDVTVSTGPSYQSQRDEANQFLETLAAVPQLFGMVADLAVKAKNLGPIGDEIAKRLTPPQFAKQEGQEPLPPQALAQIQQAQQQVQALNAYAKEIEGRLGALQAEKTAKILELESKERIAANSDKTTLLVAEAKASGALALEAIKAELGNLNQRLALLHEGEPIENEFETPALESEAIPSSTTAPPAA